MYPDGELAEAVPRDPKIGFIANARRFADAAARNEILAPAKTIADMQRVAFNNYLDAALCGLFAIVVLVTLFFGIRAALAARRSSSPTALETPYVAAASVGP